MWGKEKKKSRPITIRTLVELGRGRMGTSLLGGISAGGANEDIFRSFGPNQAEKEEDGPVGRGRGRQKRCWEIKKKVARFRPNWGRQRYLGGSKKKKPKKGGLQKKAQPPQREGERKWVQRTKIEQWGETGTAQGG